MIAAFLLVETLILQRRIYHIQNDMTLVHPIKNRGSSKQKQFTFYGSHI
jgi:hypothetical protein